ncbi:MAG: phBC6A51 family helix-turn-helix protein [Acidimicrobiia bacterium]
MSKETSSNDMQHNPTDIELSPKQTQALDLLLVGNSVTSVAQELDVDRSTIYRWHTDAYFEAEKNRKMRELRDSAKSRLVQLADKAMAVIERALEDEDPKTALAILKGIGYMNGAISYIGPTDPEVILREREAEKQRIEQTELMQQLLFKL